VEDFVKQVFIGFKLGIKKVKELWMLLRVEKKNKGKRYGWYYTVQD